MESNFKFKADLSIIKDELDRELAILKLEQEDIKTEAFQAKLLQKITKEKAKYSIKGGELKDRVNDFKRLNYILSWRYANIDKDSCSIPNQEYVGSNTPAVDSNKKLQLAKAKSKAIQIRLRLINQKN